MQFKYGKVKFGYKDTWGMNWVLKQIIADGVRKFRDTIVEKRDTGCVGVPNSVFTEDELTNFVDVTDEHFQRWVDILDKIIYSFEDKEPCSSDYYDVQMVCGEPDSRGLIPVTIVRSDEDAHEKYAEDYKIHWEKVLDGRKLFAEHFDSLWW